VVYAGSLERLNFGEGADDKGFYVVEINPAAEPGKRQVSFDFHPVAGRRFLTVNVDIEPQELDPTGVVIKAVSEQAGSVRDSIVRLNISLPAGTEDRLRDSDLRQALQEAHYATIARDIRRETRSRLGRVAVEEITPLDALKAYLESKKVAPERTQTLLEYGQQLIQEQLDKQGQ